MSGANYLKMEGINKKVLSVNRQDERRQDVNTFDSQEPQGRFGKDMLVSSPGGLSSTYHHWTRGFYGFGNSQVDKIDELGNKFVTGEYGNMYPISVKGPGEYDREGYRKLGKSEDNSEEKEELDSSFEVIPDLSIDSIDGSTENYSLLKDVSPIKVVVNTRIHYIYLFLVFIFLYFLFSLWVSTGLKFAKAYLNEGKEPTPKQYLLAASALTCIVLVFMYFTGTPFDILLNFQTD